MVLWYTLLCLLAPFINYQQGPIVLAQDSGNQQNRLHKQVKAGSSSQQKKLNLFSINIASMPRLKPEKKPLRPLCPPENRRGLTIGNLILTEMRNVSSTLLPYYGFAYLYL